MKLLITGGHPSPAFAVIDKIGKRYDVIFAGRKYSFEGDRAFSFEFNTCKVKNIPFVEINTGRVQRKITFYTLFSLFKIFLGLIESFLILIRVKPDVILTFGGYVGFPISLAAFAFRIPIVLHEQSQNLGLANRVIALFSNKICLSFVDSASFKNNKKIVFTGNPIRKEILGRGKRVVAANDKKIIYVTGGSAGSHFINENIPKIIEKLILSGYTVIHQTGDSKVFKDYEKLEKIKESLPTKFKNKYIIKKYFEAEEVAWLYKHSSLVIGRAGINTIFELLVNKSLSLLIPLSWGNEQIENAKFIKSLGVSDYVLQEDLKDENLLYAKIISLLGNSEKYKDNFNKTDKYIIYDAAEKIIDVLKSVYGQKKKESI